MKTQKPDLKSIVAKDNELITQIAKLELSELRLIAYCLAHYDSRKPDNRLFRARVDDLVSLFPIEKKSAYAVIRKTMLGLGKKPLEIQEDGKKYYWNWFSGFMYDEGTGEFEFKINPDAQPYLLKLTGNFTRYRLGDVYQFKAASTWKLYELLKRWLSSGSWEVELDELRLLLGVAGKYSRWDSFKAQINKGLGEINKVSDIRVSFDQIKRSRRIVGLLFTVRRNKPEDEDVIEVKTAKEELFLALRNAGIPDKTAKRYVDQAEQNEKTYWIQTNLQKWVNRSKSKKHPKAYLQKILKEEIANMDLPGMESTPPNAPIEDQRAKLNKLYGAKGMD